MQKNPKASRADALALVLLGDTLKLSGLPAVVSAWCFWSVTGMTEAAAVQ